MERGVDATPDVADSTRHGNAKDTTSETGSSGVRIPLGSGR